MDVLGEILLVAALTLAFVCLMEATILTVSWRGLREATMVRKKLDPVFRVMADMPPERIDKAAKFLNRKFAEWEKMERDWEARGL